MPTRKGYTQIEFPKDLAAILVIEARRLGFHSVAEYVDILNKVRLKKAWSGLDLQILAEYGKLPEIETVSGPSEKEVMEKLGLKDARKLGEPKGKPFTETGPIIQAEVKPKKQRKPEKKPEPEKEMPTSDQFFKGEK